MSFKLKKFNKGAEIFWILGIFLVPLGAAICNKANLGISMIAAPAFIIHSAIESIAPSFFSIGVVEYIVQAFFSILLCLVVLKVKLKYVLAILVGVLYGYVLDMWLLVIGVEPFEEVWLRYIMLVVGCTVTAIGVACFFRTYLPLQSYELFVTEIARKFKFNVNIVKWVYDVALLLISIILALTLFGDVKTFNWSEIYKTNYHYLGLGTLIATFINSPIITFTGKLMDKVMGQDPLIPRLKEWL